MGHPHPHGQNCQSQGPRLIPVDFGYSRFIFERFVGLKNFGWAVFEKNDFSKIWTKGYGFRHVLFSKETQASKLKPYIWNNDELWKKFDHSLFWKSFCSYHISPILAEISSEPFKPSGLLFGWTVTSETYYIMYHWFSVQMYPQDTLLPPLEASKGPKTGQKSIKIEIYIY